MRCATRIAWAGVLAVALLISLDCAWFAGRSGAYQRGEAMGRYAAQADAAYYCPLGTARACGVCLGWCPALGVLATPSGIPGLGKDSWDCILALSGAGKYGAGGIGIFPSEATMRAACGLDACWKGERP